MSKVTIEVDGKVVFSDDVLLHLRNDYHPEYHDRGTVEEVWLFTDEYIGEPFYMKKRTFDEGVNYTTIQAAAIDDVDSITIQ